jgi:hypothetical protein
LSRVLVALIDPTHRHRPYPSSKKKRYYRRVQSPMHTNIRVRCRTSFMTSTAILMQTIVR